MADREGKPRGKRAPTPTQWSKIKPRCLEHCLQACDGSAGAGSPERKHKDAVKVALRSTSRADQEQSTGAWNIMTISGAIMLGVWV